MCLAPCLAVKLFMSVHSGFGTLAFIGLTLAQCAARVPTGPAPQMATTSSLPTKPSSHACLRA